MSNLSFSSDGETTVMKERQTPTNPRTAAQSQNRSYFRESSQGYEKLSAEDLALWEDYAKSITLVGKKSKKPEVPNAFEAYKHLTQVWLAANGGVGTPPTDPPTESYGQSGVILSAAASKGAVVFTISAEADANTLVEISLQKLANANRKPSADGYRIQGYFQAAGAGEQVSISVKPGVYSASYRFVSKLSGQRTAAVTIPVAGVALAVEKGGAQGAAEKPAARGKKAA